MNGEFYGKYRGTVDSNIDPEERARLSVKVPEVLGDAAAWALPCVPYAGKGVGFFALPPKGANVWVEFEDGNVEYPVWVGCFWNKGEVPAKPAIADTKVFKTDGIELKLDDKKNAGGLTLTVGSPAVSVPTKLVIDSGGVSLTVKEGKVTISPTKIELKLSSTTLTLSMANATLKSGSANVKVATPSVSINGSSLQVL
jgi:phage baseplate assembly protein gpV